MSNIVSKKFTGMPTLTPDKIAVIKNWYRLAVNNANTVAPSSREAAYWGGVTDGLASCLNVVYSTAKKINPEVVKEVKLVTKSGNSHVKLKVGLVVVAVILMDGRLPRKIKAIWNEEVTDDRIKHISEKVADKASDISDRVQDSRDVIVGTAKDVKDKVSDKVDDVKDIAKDKTQSMKKATDEYVDKIEDIKIKDIGKDE